jgi:anti-sigma-K factor RskA
MTDKPNNGLGDRELWRRHRPRAQTAEPITGFDANLVAAWLEDTMTDEDWGALETRLAANPDRVEMLRAAAALPAAVAEAMPAGLDARLRALAPARPSAVRPSTRRLPVWRGFAEWAMAAAVLVAVAVAGFDLGSTTSTESVQIVASTAEDNIAGYQVALDTYLPTSSVSFLVEGDGR